MIDDDDIGCLVFILLGVGLAAVAFLAVVLTR